MKKFLLLSLSVLFAIILTGCMKDPEPVDTFNKSEWEKDVTEKVSEIKFTNGTWKFRKYVSYEIHSQFDEYYYGEFVITNNAQDIEKDLNFTKLTHIVKVNKPLYPKHFKRVYTEEELRELNEEYSNGIKDETDLGISVNKTFNNTVSFEIKGNTENTKFKSSYILETGFDEVDDKETVIQYYEKIEE